jgi:NADPH-dependent F420 reductase
MKVAIIGGTGRLGKRLAAQLSKQHEVIIGSRDRTKAEVTARRWPGVRGAEELAAAAECEAAILTVPYEAIGRLAALEEALAGKLVISPINPLVLDNEMYRYAAESVSAAEQVAAVLKRSRVAAALHTLPSRFLKDPGREVIDVLIAADDRTVFDEAAALVGCIPGARSLYVGPLSMASSVERITPLLLNLAKLNGTKPLTVRFVTQED